MKDVPYNNFKKKKCEVCSSTDGLTVHHLMGSEFHSYITPDYRVVPKDLITLCRGCHDQCEAEISYCIKRHLPVDPLYEAKSLIYNDYLFIKPYMLDPKKTKGRPPNSVITRVEAAIKILFNADFAWDNDLEFDIGKKWGNLKIDRDIFYKVVKSYYKAFKMRKQLWQ